MRSEPPPTKQSLNQERNTRTHSAGAHNRNPKCHTPSSRLHSPLKPLGRERDWQEKHVVIVD